LLIGAALACGATGAEATETAGAFAIRSGSARGAVLGEGYGALGGEADVMLWSPAALADLRLPHLQATYHDVYGLGLARHTSLAFAWRSGHEETRVIGDSIQVVSHRSTGPAFGVGLSALSVDLDGETYHEYAPAVCFARSVGPRAAVGVTARYLRASSTLPEVRATGYSFDVGVQVRPHDRVGIAASLRNIIGRLSWDWREESQPREVVVAAALSAPGSVSIVVGAASNLDRDALDRWNIAADAELWRSRWHLLAGWEARRSGDDMKGRASAGTRLLVAPIALDYAFIPEAHTPGDTHRATLTVFF